MKIPKFAEKPKHEPWKWLNLWLNDAELEGETEPTAMALSTIDKQEFLGQDSSCARA